ncbi:phosphatase PAP2 family protein [Actinoplanes sp. NPDC051411]|uniref:phosphatase PAP2 family protein n=1 Tax=Actinoplanes sp. NPDC051411 TaxID=3155522 RepID=UPI003447B340
MGSGTAMFAAYALQTLKRIIVPLAVLLLAMIGLGLLITKVLEHDWPFTVEDGINRGFAAHRTDPANVITLIGSFVGSTPCIIAVTAIVAFILLKTLHSWREPLFLCAAVSAQALVFLFTTLAIDRQRPAVHHLDNSPPTSSFPSGHTSAATALYCGLALVLAMQVRRTWAKVLCWLLVVFPLYVAVSRLYRGMHHPSDVTASFVNAAVCITIMAFAILNPHVAWRRSSIAAKS